MVSKNKHKKPKGKVSFKTLKEIDLHILTEKYGPEEAGQIMQFAKSLGKFFRTSKITHSA